MGRALEINQRLYQNIVINWYDLISNIAYNFTYYITKTTVKS